MFSFSLDFSFLSAWTPITLVFLPPKLDFKFLIFMSYCPCPKNPKYRVNECNNLLSPALPKATDDKWRKIIQSHTHTHKNCDSHSPCPQPWMVSLLLITDQLPLLFLSAIIPNIQLTCLTPMITLNLMLHRRNKWFSYKLPQPYTQSTKLHSLLLNLPASPPPLHPFSCWLLQDLVVSTSFFCHRTNLSPSAGFSLVHKHAQISQNIFKKLSLYPESSL